MRVSRIVLAAAFTLAVSVNALAAGAIAVDDDGDTVGGDAGYGIVTGEPSRDAAAREAMKQCRSSGNSSCRVVVRFDVCGAYASSKSYYGVGWGNTAAEAQRRALDECGQGSCKILVSDCE
jgi:Domain of unknown function (DUF4189)